MATKNVVVDLTKREKLDGTNFDMWHRKIQYLLNEQEVLETLTIVMMRPENGNTAQHRYDLETYESWVKKDHCARFTMLSSMHNDLIGEFENYPNAQEMWNQLKISYGGTSATILRALTLKFEKYVMDSKHSMAEHLRTMSTLIRDLKAASNNLSNEQ
ncbi:uncharacterized protein LOC142632583 [Castanea sativa]|uniref:uncharacterized protein LOC142632583 n=1 Tax=Castanea sativa TaxID=21020 RepID=UPI003F6513BE